MKKFTKFFGIITFIMVIMCGLVACDDSNNNDKPILRLVFEIADYNNWQAIVNEDWLLNGYSLKVGDKIRLTYSFTSNYEISYFWASIVDTTEGANYWKRLTNESNYQYNLNKGKEHTGSITFDILSSAFNGSSDAGTIWFWIRREQNQTSPLVWEFTEFKLEKIN